MKLFAWSNSNVKIWQLKCLKAPLHTAYYQKILEQLVGFVENFHPGWFQMAQQWEYTGSSLRTFGFQISWRGRSPWHFYKDYQIPKFRSNSTVHYEFFSYVHLIEIRRQLFQNQ